MMMVVATTTTTRTNDWCVVSLMILAVFFRFVNEPLIRHCIYLEMFDSNVTTTMTTRISLSIESLLHIYYEESFFYNLLIHLNPTVYFLPPTHSSAHIQIHMIFY